MPITSFYIIFNLFRSKGSFVPSGHQSEIPDMPFWGDTENVETPSYVCRVLKPHISHLVTHKAYFEQSVCLKLNTTWAQHVCFIMPSFVPFLNTSSERQGHRPEDEHCYYFSMHSIKMRSWLEIKEMKLAVHVTIWHNVQRFTDLDRCHKCHELPSD